MKYQKKWLSQYIADPNWITLIDLCTGLEVKEEDEYSISLMIPEHRHDCASFIGLLREISLHTDVIFPKVTVPINFVNDLAFQSSAVLDSQLVLNTEQKLICSLCSTDKIDLFTYYSLVWGVKLCIDGKHIYIDKGHNLHNQLALQEAGAKNIQCRAQNFIVIPFNPSACRTLLGLDISNDALSSYLNKIALVQVKDTCWEISVSELYTHLHTELELISYCMRVHGYNKLLSDCLPVTQTRIPSKKPVYKSPVNLGYIEVKSFGLVNPEENQNLAINQRVQILNPMNLKSELRSSLVPGLQSKFLYNAARKIDHIKIYEQGNVFSKVGKEILQIASIAGLCSGNRYYQSWSDTKVDIYQVKGEVEQLITCSVQYKGISSNYIEILHQGNKCGYIQDLGDFIVWEFEQKLSMTLPVSLSSVLTTPTSVRDISVLMPIESLIAGEILDYLCQLNVQGINAVYIHSVYFVDTSISVTYRFEMQYEAALNREAIQNVIDKIMLGIVKQYPACEIK